ncbi:MAG: hypothetical protein FWE50_03090 [Alphaproteobacteria bacterium]|nr:hypothetical protein [Alphaproteobacteria bacterium]
MKRTKKYLPFLLTALILIGCGKRKDRAEYDRLLVQRDSLENVRVALIIALEVLENTSMAADLTNWEQAAELVDGWATAYEKNDSALNVLQTKYPEFPKPVIQEQVVETHVINLR